MGTFQEVTTFAGNVLTSAAASKALLFAASQLAPKASSLFKGASVGTVGATAGFDNTVFATRSACPECGSQARWVDC